MTPEFGCKREWTAGPDAMPKGTILRSRFDVRALRDMAGDKPFARGQGYHRDGKVEIVHLDDRRVAARVVGTEIYRATFEGAGKRFSGKCSCPAFSGFGFCKHLVATALAANDLDPDEAAKAGNRFARLREYLRRQGADALVERLMALAERSPAVLEDLELACAVASDDDGAVLPRLRGAIADAVSPGGWASGIAAVIERIDGLVANGKAALALPLLDDFFAEMEEAPGG